MHDQPTRPKHSLTRTIDVLLIIAMVLIVITNGLDLFFKLILTECTFG